MTPAARIAAAIDLLGEIDRQQRPADGVVAAFFRNRRYIGSKDRSAIAERVYGVLRRRARLDWHIRRIVGNDAVGPRRQVIADLAVEAAEEPAALFGSDRYAAPALSPEEHRLAGALAGQGLDDPAMPPSVRYECPDWALTPLEAAFGDRLGEELAALLAPAPLDLRVNEAITTRDRALARLRRDGIPAEPTPLSPLGIRVEGRPPLAGHILFKTGAVEVQDEGSQLVALLADARPGQQVADFCAGAGGKALAMAARMAGKGRVVACDVAEGRLIRARERIKRAKLDNIEPRLLSTERDRWVGKQKGKFDRVVIDAPCSGTGAWRRNPDARWRETDLAALTDLQGRLLDSACRLVKPGGRLVYATCSLLPPENGAQMARFLETHAEFRPVPVGAVWPEVVGTAAPDTAAQLQLTPARHGTDGFFIAIAEKTEEA
ncbi:MAG: methyltransferase domain-containing protein [Alphaproteobacteria bacterium]|jgi:16S rRNA (cytosine967-C5)-methyltransferase|nr:methyltransferase domain-containing protein [Alphaproteobacteria bacterium]